MTTRSDSRLLETWGSEGYPSRTAERKKHQTQPLFCCEACARPDLGASQYAKSETASYSGTPRFSSIRFRWPGNMVVLVVAMMCVMHCMLYRAILCEVC